MDKTFLWAENLPAYKIAEQLNNELKSNSAVVVTAPPGAGKSTLLPLTILEGLFPEGNILVIEPRRIAARQVAERMAGNIGERAGHTVGYSVRFENRTSNLTRIEVVTEGVMMRKLLGDSMLEDVSIVIFDEFHERSLTSDVILALVREIQQVVRPELKVVIMSATIDTEEICKALGATLVECDGKLFDVERILRPRDNDYTDPESISQDVCRTVTEACLSHDGDILAFLPGQAEIGRCEELLESLKTNTEGLRICPLYGLLPPEKQQQAIAPSRDGERKIVLATSIAETSLTIEGVKVVVDSGYCRHLVYDHNTGLSHLETVRISQDMATQRRGRAGRVSEGTCYQLWSNAIALNMKPNRTPEILDADLSSAIMNIMAHGESDIEALPWLTLPPHSNVIKAQLILEELCAIEEKDKGFVLTDKGRRMAKLPCHPRIASMLIMAHDGYGKALAADIAALIEEKDPLSQADNDVDINTRIGILRQMRKRGNPGRWTRIAKIAEQYRHIINAREDNTGVDANLTGHLLASAYPERIGCLTGNGQYRLSGGGNATIDSKDMLSSFDWIVVASMNPQNGRTFLASPVDAKSLSLTEYDNVSWNQRHVLAQREWRVGRLVVKSKPLQDIPREKINEVIIEAAEKDGLSMFSFDDKVKMLQRRINTVGEWHPEMQLPDVSIENVIARAKDWLPMFAGKSMSQTDLRKIDMEEVIWSLIDYDDRQKIERLAPSHIQMPNGHRIRLDYRQGAEAPVLSVRLQECFGMMETPRVDDGRMPILMELLSPGFKPVQLTQDLKSFWQTTYFEVRKELRRRYPKHAWPDSFE